MTKKSQQQTLLDKLKKSLNKLRKKDEYQIFYYPVDPNEAPQYYDIISDPMDFATMEKKLLNGTYTTVDDFVSDFDLMMENCMYFNPSDTIFYKEAVKLKKWGDALLRKLPRGDLYPTNDTSAAAAAAANSTSAIAPATPNARHTNANSSDGAMTPMTPSLYTPSVTTTAGPRSYTKRKRDKDTQRQIDVKPLHCGVGVDNDFNARRPLTNIDILVFRARDIQLHLQTKRGPLSRTHSDVAVAQRGLSAPTYRQPLTTLPYEQYSVDTMATFIDGMPASAIKRLCIRLDTTMAGSYTKHIEGEEASRARLQEVRATAAAAAAAAKEAGDDDDTPKLEDLVYPLASGGLVVTREYHEELLKQPAVSSPGDPFGVSREASMQLDTLVEHGYEVNLSTKLATSS